MEVTTVVDPETAQGSNELTRLPEHVLHTRAASAMKVQNDMHEVLDLVLGPDRKFAWDFLFADDVSTEVTCVSNAAAVANSSFSVQTVVGSDAYDVMFSSVLTVLTVPAYSVTLENGSTLTLGCFVSIASCEPEVQGIDAFMGSPNIGRFVADVSTGRRLDIAHGHSGNLTLTSLCHMTLVGSVALRHSSMTCNTALLRLGARTQNMSIIFSSIIVSHMSFGERNCKVCGLPPEAKCGCVLTLRLPRHALDYSMLNPNEAMFAGTIAGRTSSVFNKMMSTNTMEYLRNWWGAKSGTIDDKHMELYSPKMFTSLSAVAVLLPHTDSAAKLLGQGLNAILQRISLVRTTPALSAPPEIVSSTDNDARSRMSLFQRVLNAPPGTLVTAAVAPAPQDQRPTTTYVDPREERRRQRQIRNRQSAALSNARRKDRNNARKVELASLRERVIVLKRRENELRGENAALRNNVRETGLLKAQFKDT